MDKPTADKLRSIFGNLAVEMGELLDPVYGMAIAKFTVTEALALDEYLRNRKYTEAKQLVRSRMTEEQLLAEKQQLTQLTWEMAEGQANAVSFSTAVFVAGMRVLLFAALGMVGLP